MLVPGIDFEAVRSQVSMAQVLKLLGFVAQRSKGEQVRGPCPVHRSASPRSRSFSANLGKNAYRCFGCGSAGNQLDLWAAATKTSLHDATIDLCEKLHLEVPWIRRWVNGSRGIPRTPESREEEPVLWRWRRKTTCESTQPFFEVEMLRGLDTQRSSGKAFLPTILKESTQGILRTRRIL